MDKQHWTTTDLAKMVKALTQEGENEQPYYQEDPRLSSPSYHRRTQMDKQHWTTIETAKRIELLRKFRFEVETEAKASLASIETNLALALADIAEALGITAHKDLLQVLGDSTYLTVYRDPIPYRPAHPPHHKVRLLLAKLRETWRGKWGGKAKVETEPCQTA